MVSPGVGHQTEAAEPLARQQLSSGCIEALGVHYLRGGAVRHPSCADGLRQRRRHPRTGVRCTALSEFLTRLTR